MLGPHLSYDEVVTRLERTPKGRISPREVDGILIDFDSDFQNPEWDYVWGHSRARLRSTQIEGNNFTVRTGWVEIAAKDINSGSDWLAHMASHEMGHAIGHVATDLDFGPDTHPRYREDTIARYVDYDRGVWTGPAVTEANGGVQVSFQRLDKYRQPSPDGELDFGHLGACEMIMSYCGNPIQIPHEMDFAFMRDIGYTVEDSYPTVPEMYSYGAWVDHSAWSVTAKRPLFFDPTRIDDFIDVGVAVMGNPSIAAFSDTHIGSVTWNGSLLATDLATYAPVFGGAEISLFADTLDGKVAFTELETVRESDRGLTELTGWRIGQLDYPVSVTGNGFQDEGGRVLGALFGPSHEEAAGTLHDEAERITGAFGGRR